MKKKYRDIVVNNKKYCWLIQPNQDKQEGDGILKIYHNKKLIYKETIESDVVITPKIVSIKISENEDYN
jgi:hypothetical protein